jgi:hypothetical protein
MKNMVCTMLLTLHIPFTITILFSYWQNISFWQHFKWYTHVVKPSTKTLLVVFCMVSISVPDLYEFILAVYIGMYTSRINSCRLQLVMLRSNFHLGIANAAQLFVIYCSLRVVIYIVLTQYNLVCMCLC